MVRGALRAYGRARRAARAAAPRALTDQSRNERELVSGREKHEEDDPDQQCRGHVVHGSLDRAGGDPGSHRNRTADQERPDWLAGERARPT